MLPTSDPGFCGFVGAEGVVPDRFALLFGTEFLYSMLVAGLSVRESMLLLWKKHRPMALFYGCYAHPGFSLKQDSEYGPLPTDFAATNYER
jgi:hypothetical protein